MNTDTPTHAGAVADAQYERIPLAIDLDGTLSKSDTLYEGFIGCLKGGISSLPELWSSLRQGKAAFKRCVAVLSPFDASLLPYNAELVSFIKMQKLKGRRIGLFTGADQAVANSVATHLALFDTVHGSDGRTNLTGNAKTEAIQREFGVRFAYAGNDSADHAIFRSAESVILVGSVERLRRKLKAAQPVEAEFPSAKPTFVNWLRALRVRHWIKNSLVFIAPILGIQSVTPVVALNAALLFVAVGMLASATYLVNDMFDLAADRQHPIKQYRPFASGVISIQSGAVAAIALLAASTALSLLLPIGAAILLLVYLVLTLSYSLYFKHIPMVDVLLLAGLFTIRVTVGGVLLPTPISPWLLTFSMLFFLGLAVTKRYAELERVLRTDSGSGRARGYSARDLPILLATGIASGISAVVIFTIYLISEQYPRHFYANPGVLWGIMPILLIWTLRVWHLSVHGRMNEDPLMFAIRDKVSLLLGFLVLAILFVAWV